MKKPSQVSRRDHNVTVHVLRYELQSHVIACILSFAGKRHKSWRQRAAGNLPVEAFPAYYLGSSAPHSVDFLYPTDDHLPTFSSEADAPGNSGEMMYGNYPSSLRLTSYHHHHQQQPWIEQPHEYHGNLTTMGNHSDLQVHSFSEDFPLSACFSGTHEYQQWVYPSSIPHFASVTPNASDSPNPTYHHCHEYSLIPASIPTNPHYFHSSQEAPHETVAEVHDSSPRDFSESKSTSLFIACDAESLSEYQCLIRKQVEFFSATYLDIEMTVQGRNRKIHAGQVGVRCRHCADIPIKKRARGAVYYPSKLSCVYQAAQNMASVHLVKHCTRVPESIRAELMKKDRKSSAGSGKDYWAVGARSVGIIEIDGRLWYESDAPNFQDTSLTMI